MRGPCARPYSGKKAVVLSKSEWLRFLSSQVSIVTVAAFDLAIALRNQADQLEQAERGLVQGGGAVSAVNNSQGTH